MIKRVKIQIAICVLIGIVFLAIGAYQWYNLYQIEQGLKQGELAIVLLKIYEVAGKWGVFGFYSLFSIYCFWRAKHIYKLGKKYERFDDSSYATYDEEDNAKG